SWTQKGFDRTALIHRPISLGHLIEWQDEVQNLAGIDFSFPYEIDQLRQIAAYWRRPAMEVHMGIEERLAVQLDAMEVRRHSSCGLRGEPNGSLASLIPACRRIQEPNPPLPPSSDP